MSKLSHKVGTGIGAFLGGALKAVRPIPVPGVGPRTICAQKAMIAKQAFRAFLAKVIQRGMTTPASAWDKHWDSLDGARTMIGVIQGMEISNLLIPGDYAAELPAVYDGRRNLLPGGNRVIPRTVPRMQNALAQYSPEKTRALDAANALVRCYGG